MANARKLPSGAYRVRVTKNGVTKSFTDKDKYKASLMAATWLNSQDDVDSTVPTVAEALVKYIESKRAVLSPATIRGYEQMRKNYYEELNGMKLTDLDTHMVQTFVSGLALNRSPKTVRNIYGLFISAFTMFYPERIFKITFPLETEVKRTVPTDDQLNALLDNSEGDLKIAIILGTFGLRRGEVCALTYEDLYPDLGLIQINKDLVLDENNEWVLKNIPKTSSSIRVVRIPKKVIESFGSGTGRIIQRSPRAISHSFERLCKKLQINISFHSLRRYMASILHALGFPDKYIQEMGGWSSPRTMQKCYENVLVDKNVEYTKKMHDYFEKNIDII